MLSNDSLYTGFFHGAVTVTLQVLVGLLLGDWLLGGVAAIMFYLGREHAQREYKIAGYVKTGMSVKDLKPWQAFDFKNWSVDSLIDLLIPVAFAATVALVMI